MAKGAILERPAVKPVTVQPKLRDIFVPCPICRGTLDMDIHGKVVCCSCKATWTVRGEPIQCSTVEDEED